MVKVLWNCALSCWHSSRVLSQGCIEATWGPRRIWEVRSFPVVNIKSEERETMQIIFLITNKEKWEVLKYVEDQHSK